MIPPETPATPDTPDSDWFARLWAIKSAQFDRAMAESGIQVEPIQEEAENQDTGFVVTFVPKPPDDPRPTPKPSVPPG